MKIATWNCGDGPDPKKGRGLDRLVTAGADVIALQEAGDRVHLIESWCRFNDWDVYFGDEPGAPSVPILWNPKQVHARIKGTTPATDATFVGKLGAGPSTMKPKVWNHIRFADNDLEFVFINGHVVPSVYLPRRRKLARRHIAVLAEMAERRKGRVPVVAVGDFNMKPTDRLTKPLRDLGMKQRTKDATHGRRTIDHVWTLDLSGSVDVIEMPSDHRSAVLTIKEKP